MEEKTENPGQPLDLSMITDVLRLGGAINTADDPVTKNEPSSKSSINSPKEIFSVSESKTSAVNPFEETGYDKATEVSGLGPSTSFTPSELIVENPPLSREGENILNFQMEMVPVNLTSPSILNTTINQSPVQPKSAPTETPVSTSSSEKTVVTETDKSSINVVKEKEGGFSKFLERVTESKIGKALNLPDLNQVASDFAKVTKSEVLGTIPNFEKIKTGTNVINQVKESSKESLQAFKESTNTQRAVEVMNKAKEMVSSNEKELLVENSPGTATETQRTETIEKTSPVVTQAAPPPASAVTQNQENQQTILNSSSSSNQGGSTSSQKTESNIQKTEYKPAQMTTDLPQTQMGGQPLIISNGEMEKRLQRIEFILMNGIEVTVKQY